MFILPITTRRGVALSSADDCGELVTRREKIRAALLLSVMFAIGYAATNRLNGLRDAYTVWRPAWEAIPYCVWMIVPYVSLNFLYVAAPLCCRRRDHLQTLLQRAAFVLSISAAFFLLVPTRLDVVRPPQSHPIAAFLQGLLDLDAPFSNLLPSLHCSLSVVLCGVFAAGRTLWQQRAITAGFATIVLSTLFTWQHFLLDVVTGVMLGGACLRRFPLAASPPIAADEGPTLLPFPKTRTAGPGLSRQRRIRHAA